VGQSRARARGGLSLKGDKPNLQSADEGPFFGVFKFIYYRIRS
jgi:hypothetical protein